MIIFKSGNILEPVHDPLPAKIFNDIFLAGAHHLN